MAKLSMLQGGRPVVLLLAHSRVEKLRSVIVALKGAHGVANYDLVAVQDGKRAPVSNLLKEELEADYLFVIENPEVSGPAQRISRSLKCGLDFAFFQLGAPHVVVIEDDIVVSPDFLDFVNSAHERFGLDKGYRGVNGFSAETVAPPADLDGAELCVRLNYGLGWGWSVTPTIYEGMRPFLSSHRRSNPHWDYSVEPYVRTGFVVNPLISKIQNRGFDGSASHTTLSPGDGLENRIDQSFDLSNTLARRVTSLQESGLPFSWRMDCINLSTLSSLGLRKLYLIRALVYVAHLLQLSQRARVRDAGHRIQKIGDRWFGNSFCKASFNGGL